MNTELTIFEPKNGLQLLFTPSGVDEFYIEIEKLAESFKGDISTKKGRAEIKSFARKIASAKRRLDEQGQALTEGERKKIDLINIERKRLFKKLEDLQDKITAEVDEFEAKEEARAKLREDRIAAIEALKTLDGFESSDAITKKIAAINELAVFDWQEFQGRAILVSDATKLQSILEQTLLNEENAAKLKKLEEERIEKERLEREEKLKLEAAEQAKKAAEEKAEADRKALRLE